MGPDLFSQYFSEVLSFVPFVPKVVLSGLGSCSSQAFPWIAVCHIQHFQVSRDINNSPYILPGAGSSS